MQLFFSYVFIFGGAAVLTAGMLARFIYRGRLIFDLQPRWRALAYVVGILMLIIGMALYVYAEPKIIGEALSWLRM